MAESNINVTPGSGGPNIDLEVVDNGNARQVIVIGDSSTGTKVAPVDATLGLSVNVTNSTSPLPSGAATSANQTNASQKTQIVDGSGNVIASTSNALNVQVENFPATQPISAASLPLPTGASTSSAQTTIIANQTNGTQQTQITQGGNIANVNATNELLVTDTDLTLAQGSTTSGQLGPLVQGAVLTSPPTYTTAQTSPLTMTTAGAIRVDASTTASNLIVSTTAATGVAVTATLPAVAGQFHYITGFTILKYFTVANAASATPLVVTTTNLPGSLAITFGQPLGTVGSTDFREESFSMPIKSSVVNTATTIVCPATTGIIWRVNVFYYAAP